MHGPHGVERSTRLPLRGISPEGFFFARLPSPNVLADPQARSDRGMDRGRYDVLAEGVVVGRIMKAAAAPVGTPWMWTLAFGQHEDCTPTHGYEATREAAMAAFAKSWPVETSRPPRMVGGSPTRCTPKHCFTASALTFRST
jgi:hypothetical protein